MSPYSSAWATAIRNFEPPSPPMTPVDNRLVSMIRSTLADLYSKELADGVRVQYGGSVKAGNIRDFMAHPEIDGALVGGASLDPEDLALIVKH